MSTENRQDPLAKVETERRDFLKKIAIAAAFAAPTIATFSVDGMRKKAFAQTAYDAPEVISLTAAPSGGQAEVLFNQPMNTGVGGDISRAVQICRTTEFEGYTWDYSWKWVGDTKQVITFSGQTCVTDNLTVTYNQEGCGIKFVGANGVELKPFRDNIQVTDDASSC